MFFLVVNKIIINQTAYTESYGESKKNMLNKKLFVLIFGVMVWVGGASSALAEDAPVVPPVEPTVPVCVLPQTLVDNVCTDPAQVVPPAEPIIPVCVLPQTLVNNVCTDPAPIVPPVDPIVPVCVLPQTLVDNVCTDPVVDINPPLPVPDILPTDILVQEPVIIIEPKLEPVPDPATSPSSAKLTVLMPDGSVPPFPVFVTFVGVGNKNYGGKINSNGEANVIIPSGRYYTDVMPINTDYVQGEDGPSFFMEADATRDFGVIKLKLKSEATNQNLQDKTLEENIIKDAQTEGGIGKILALIVKLLMKILEAVTALGAK